MDKLRNDIQNTLKLQEETTKNMMSEIFNVGINNDDNLSDVSNLSKISVIHEEMGIDYNKLIIDLDDVSKIESKSKQTKKKVAKKEAIEM
jgi:hypothetical protein